MSAKEQKEKDVVLKLAVKVVSPTGSVFTGAADFVLAPGKEGILGIYPQHTKIVSLLRKGELLIRDEAAGEQKISVEEGIIRANRDQIEIILTG